MGEGVFVPLLFVCVLKRGVGSKRLGFLGGCVAGFRSCAETKINCSSAIYLHIVKADS